MMNKKLFKSVIASVTAFSMLFSGSIISANAEYLEYYSDSTGFGYGNYTSPQVSAVGVSSEMSGNEIKPLTFSEMHNALEVGSDAYNERVKHIEQLGFQSFEPYDGFHLKCDENVEYGRVWFRNLTVSDEGYASAEVIFEEGNDNMLYVNYGYASFSRFYNGSGSSHESPKIDSTQMNELIYGIGIQGEYDEKIGMIKYKKGLNIYPLTKLAYFLAEDYDAHVDLMVNAGGDVDVAPPPTTEPPITSSDSKYWIFYQGPDTKEFEAEAAQKIHDYVYQLYAEGATDYEVELKRTEYYDEMLNEFLKEYNHRTGEMILAELGVDVSDATISNYASLIICRLDAEQLEKAKNNSLITDISVDYTSSVSPQTTAANTNSNPTFTTAVNTGIIIKNEVTTAAPTNEELLTTRPKEDVPLTGTYKFELSLRDNKTNEKIAGLECEMFNTETGEVLKNG